MSRSANGAAPPYGCATSRRLAARRGQAAGPQRELLDDTSARGVSIVRTPAESLELVPVVRHGHRPAATDKSSARHAPSSSQRAAPRAAGRGARLLQIPVRARAPRRAASPPSWKTLSIWRRRHRRGRDRPTAIPSHQVQLQGPPPSRSRRQELVGSGHDDRREAVPMTASQRHRLRQRKAVIFGFMNVSVEEPAGARSPPSCSLRAARMFDMFATWHAGARGVETPASR